MASARGLLIEVPIDVGERVARPETFVGELLVGLGLLGAVVQLSLTGALRLAPVSVVTPMDYSSLLWAIAAGWWFFGTLPADTTWVGAPLIVASGRS